ncbi:hypothetical protein AB6N24_07495 [Cellulomonas sp. 179-A 4D5 NHS]|uniref:hypothetical protein n=1 Tax=Cellulomonas sp. 179-A 4D5 NHS TaxID=3142378 RepID=UPI00399FCDA5
MDAKQAVRAYEGLDAADREDFLRDCGLLVRSSGVPLPPPLDDVAASAERLAIAMSVLGTKDERRDASGPAAVLGGVATSVAALEATSTALAKWWASGMALVAAGGTGLVAWRVAAEGFWADADTGVQVALVIGAAVVLSAAFIALALVLDADLRARSGAGAAQYAARARMVDAYLRTARSGRAGSGDDDLLLAAGVFHQRAHDGSSSQATV